MINFWSINCIAQWSGKSRVTALRRRGSFRMMILDGLGRGVDSCFDAFVAARTLGGSRSMTGHDRRSTDQDHTWSIECR